MPEMPQADSIQTESQSDRPPLHLTGSSLAIASPTSISEACFSVPAVRAIHHDRPHGILVVFTTDEIAPIWRRVVEIDRVVSYSASDSPRKITKLLAECELPFDSSIAWDENPAALAFAKFGIKQRLGYPTEKLGPHLTDPVEVIRRIGPVEHQVNHYLLFVRKLGIDPFQAANFATPKRPDDGESYRVAIVPGSDFGPASEWPLAKFLELARKIAPHCELVILPSPGRPGPAVSLARKLGNAYPVSKLEGNKLLDFLATCVIVIANDGSIPHLASFVGTPGLVIFGPNEPEWKRPLGKIHQIVHHREACSACLLTKCPLDHRCLAGISVAEVVEKLSLIIPPSQTS